MPEDQIQIAPLTALIREKGDQADPLLYDAANQLQSAGRKVVGVIQECVPNPGSCCDDFYLRDLNTGTRLPISQQLGRGSRGCRLNYGHLADALVRIERQLDKSSDVLILNRFGYSESKGGGFRPLIENAVELDIPVLLAVNPSYRQAWLDYAGPYCASLPANSYSVRHWLQLMLRTFAKQPGAYEMA